MKVILSHHAYGNTSQQGELSDLKMWINSFTPFEWRPEDFLLLSSNIPPGSITHAGLIYYLHACWAKELGCVLRPDMIYFTVLSEIANFVLKTPQDFKNLLTEKDGKEEIIVRDPMATHGNLNIHNLCKALRQTVSSTELCQLICDVTFKGDDNLSHEARCMTFCQMGVPFYNYLSTLCGIKSVDIQGDFADWKKLFDTLGRLRIILSRYDHSGYITKMLKNTVQIVSTIIHFTFDSTFKSDPKYSDQVTFFNDIFHYGKNTVYGSGHEKCIVSGWARNLYICQGDDLVKFNPSMTYVPYTNIETNRKFVQVCTLAYSDLIDDTIVPHYGKVMFEVLNSTIFDKIALK